MPTEVVKTIRSAGGDYTSLSAWQTAEVRNLVTADEIAVAECYNDWPTGLENTVSISGWTTDSTRYPIIRSAPGHGPEGLIDNGFRIKAANNYGQTLVIWSSLTRVRDIGIVALSVTNRTNVIDATRTISVIERCVIHNKDTNQYSSGITIGTHNPLIRGCLIHGDSIVTNKNGVVGSDTRYSIGRVHNCTIVGWDVGIAWWDSSFQAKVEVRNTVMFGNNNDYSINSSFSPYLNSGNNATDEASITFFPDSIANVVSGDFADAANDDFHLASGSALIGGGDNLWSTTNTVDQDGDLWPEVGAWDIGFDYYVSAGPTYTVTLSSPTATATGSTTATVGCQVTYT